ncbi:MAG TPA: DNA recombination protein RmuC [Bacteroidales bacterium]|nr:DNA recombination protein RmuC [Bacteroidales bacterium]
MIILLLLLSASTLLVLLLRKPDRGAEVHLRRIEEAQQRITALLDRTDATLREEFQRNRTESNEIARTNRDELAGTLKASNDQFAANVKDLKEAIEKQLIDIRTDNNTRLEEMRVTVDEKLQKTLNERLSQSFRTVGDQLEAVQRGLGEMKNLATDVGGLKKVLANVKQRGGIGEVQLAMLLEQILAPGQYEANVHTRSGSGEVVEFAIKLPGKDDDGKHIWLPVDAKFPKDVYEQLQDAYELADPDAIAQQQRQFDAAIKKSAKDIRDKYLDPPVTTDFGIMFLPFEGIYAEVVRKAALLEELMHTYKVIVTGPTTLAAILNSLQMGFRTLAIEKRSSEVWQILGAVKTEFGKFSDYLGKAQRNIQTGLDQLEGVVGTRTKAIQRRLKNVTALNEAESQALLPELNDNSDDLPDEDESIV